MNMNNDLFFRKLTTRVAIAFLLTIPFWMAAASLDAAFRIGPITRSYIIIDAICHFGQNLFLPLMYATLVLGIIDFFNKPRSKFTMAMTAFVILLILLGLGISFHA
jgi:hypothetical protein